jgi:MFS family permease
MTSCAQGDAYIAHPPSGARARRFVATAAVLCGLVVAAFEGTVVTSAMPTIARELGGMGAYSWVFSAFLLASTVGVLTCGKLADAYGRRPVFVGGMVLFLAGSALCGLSTSIGGLVAFRILQGLGAGAIQPIAMTISADLYTLQERARVQAVFTSAWGMANVVGPIIGGFLVIHLSWRWVFLVNVPVGLVAIALLLPSYRDPPRPARSASGLGAALVAGGVSALALIALEPSALAPGWRAPIAAAALVAVPAFVLQQRRSAAPLVPPSLLAHRVVRAGIAAGLFAGAMLYLCAAYVPLWMTTHAHLDAITSGAALVPLLVGWAFGSSFGVRVLVRHGMRASVAGGFAIAVAGALALAVIASNDLPVRWAYVALAVMGAGLGPAASTSLVAPQSAAPWDQRGMVTSVIYAARMLGGSLAVAAMGAGDAGGAARFVGLAVVSLVAAVTLAAIAPPDVAELRTGLYTPASDGT